MKKIFLLLLLSVCVSMGKVQAQQGEVVLGVKGGNNTLFGAFGALSVEVDYSLERNFAMRGGVLYNTIGRGVAELRPQYFHDLNFGRVSAELLLNYAHQNRVNNYAIGAGAMLDCRPIWATLGYYYRFMTRGADVVHELFNIYYELGVRFLPESERWDLNVIFSNSRMLELERHYQPSFLVEAWWYPLSQLGVQVGAAYKPAGMFNISSDFYQLYANVGLCYRW